MINIMFCPDVKTIEFTKNILLLDGHLNGMCMKEKLFGAIKDKSISIEALRIYFGLALFLKGIYFIGNMKVLFGMLSYQFPYIDFIFAHYVVLSHIIGGLFIALGLFTRYAALINLPVLFSAIIFDKIQHGLFSSGAEFELAFMVFVLLVFFVIQGSGQFSLDQYIKASHEQLLADEEKQSEKNRDVK